MKTKYSFIDENRGVKYATLDDEHLEGAINVIAISFLREPMVKALGIQLQELLPVAQQACELSLEDQLSIVALNDVDETIGCLVSYNFANMPQIQSS